MNVIWGRIVLMKFVKGALYGGFASLGVSLAQNTLPSDPKQLATLALYAFLTGLVMAGKKWLEGFDPERWNATNP